MRGGQRPSGSGCDQGPGSEFRGNSAPIQGQFSATATAQQPVQRPLQRGSSEGRARVERGSSVGQVSGLSWADRGPQGAYRVTGQEALARVDRTVEGWKRSYGTGYIRSANGILPPRDLPPEGLSRSSLLVFQTRPKGLPWTPDPLPYVAVRALRGVILTRCRWIGTDGHE